LIVALEELAELGAANVVAKTRELIQTTFSGLTVPPQSMAFDWFWSERPGNQMIASKSLDVRQATVYLIFV
jgi:hypothetical protein